MSSIGIATMGMYDGPSCLPEGGGAPQMPQEEVKPTILVKNVVYKKKETDDAPIIIIKEVT